MHRKKTAQATHEKHTIGAGGWQVQGQPGLQRATLSHKTTKSNVLTELKKAPLVLNWGNTQLTRKKDQKRKKKKLLEITRKIQ